MAIIATTSHKAEVRAVGNAMNATVNFSGALMEMLATVYVYILMAAIREAIQNACDASKRAGLPFSEGVMVQLPTKSNPVITVTDKGSGMSSEFMTSTYLSFGSSTKAGDNGSAGGLGVGRWAAYGYIRECYIATCQADDMIERTYFQFQGDAATPQVQLAAEVPGTAVGTRVYFPVKETDLAEALTAVSWLKEVMQLTMGDSFSVDTPAALPKVLPDHSGTVLNLGDFDTTLQGVRVYPMKGESLQYGRQGLRRGSLVVMANQEVGVGGLPFHVQSPSNVQSVFDSGMVIEVPLSFNLPFMPSREELKYTDEVNALLRRIDVAAGKAVAAEVSRLYSLPDLASKSNLSNLIGNDEGWHWFARDTRGTGPLTELLRKATGGEPWRGKLLVRVPESSLLREVQVKFTEVNDPVLRETYSAGGHMVRPVGKVTVGVSFKPNFPIIFVVNDLKTGGQGRFRAMLRDLSGKQTFLYLTSETAGAAQAAADSLNSVFGHQVKVLLTSSFPAEARKVVGSRVIASRSRGASLTYYCLKEKKQKTEAMSFTTLNPAEPQRIWIGKTGAQLEGMATGVTLALLFDQWGGNATSALARLGATRLYLLTDKQVGDLEAVKTDLKDAGLWDATAEDLVDDADSREALMATEAVKGWVTLEDALALVVATPEIQAVLTGKLVRSVNECFALTQLVTTLAAKPRMELTGTSFDKAMVPYIDLLNGKNLLQKRVLIDESLSKLCEGLILVGNNLCLTADDSPTRQELAATLKQLSEVGHVDYEEEHVKLQAAFPLLQTLTRTMVGDSISVDHLCRALAVVYR